MRSVPGLGYAPPVDPSRAEHPPCLFGSCCGVSIHPPQLDELPYLPSTARSMMVGWVFLVLTGQRTPRRRYAGVPPAFRRRSAGGPPAVRRRSARDPHRYRTGAAPVPHRCRTGAAPVPPPFRSESARVPANSPEGENKFGCFFSSFLVFLCFWWCFCAFWGCFSLFFARSAELFFLVFLLALLELFFVLSQAKPGISALTRGVARSFTWRTCGHWPKSHPPPCARWPGTPGS